MSWLSFGVDLIYGTREIKPSLVYFLDVSFFLVRLFLDAYILFLAHLVLSFTRVALRSAS